jgi:hypothetical protein
LVHVVDAKHMHEVHASEAGMERPFVGQIHQVPSLMALTDAQVLSFIFPALASG